MSTADHTLLSDHTGPPHQSGSAGSRPASPRRVDAESTREVLTRPGGAEHFSRLLVTLVETLAAGRSVFERVAGYGQRLARHRERGPLYEDAAALLCDLLGADQAWLVTLDGTDTRLRARCGSAATADSGDRARSRTVIRVPVVYDGELAAVLFAVRSAGTPFSADAIAAARIFAEQLAVALANTAHYERLRTHATRDSLTGLANRYEVSQQLERLLDGSGQRPVGLLFLDLDQFKLINDQLGHEAGDELLREVAARLRDQVRTGDVLGRFGGDEFVLVIPDGTDAVALAELGRRLSQAVAGEYRLGGEPVRVTASVGGVLGVPGRTDTATLLRSADAAMYAAKQRGPGRVTVPSEIAVAGQRDRLDLREEVSSARRRGELELHYQPVMALAPVPAGPGPGHPDEGCPRATGESPLCTSGYTRVVALEALLRWQHPRHGTVPPDVLVPLAEDAGVLAEVGDWALAQACAQLARWRRTSPGAERVAVSVNLAAQQLAAADSAERILTLIRDAGLSPSDVWLEVTEHRFRGADVTAGIARLDRAGVRVVLDDFGGACSSLTFLRQLAVRAVKIDLRLMSGAPDGSVINAMLAAVRAMGLTPIAEGVESAGQAHRLASLGCPMAQGYFWDQPAPPDRVGHLLD